MKRVHGFSRFFLTANVFLVACLCCTSAMGAFDPVVLGQSTVRITIKQGGKIKSAATGFVWQNPKQIVTSLHVLHHDDAEVIVEFGGVKRIARVVKVLPYADLVLLEVDEAVDGWVPLTDKSDNKPPYKAPITALGFNAGASGSMTRDLHKGHANPEKLKGLLPPGDRRDLEAVKIPDIELDIYYLQGSLLPGFSGSPVVDADGKLIGIGDGGLENGASNVSWVIPARFLDELTASKMEELPGNLEKAGQLMSADIVDLQDTGATPYEEIVYEFGEDSWHERFVFVKTKTRSLRELLESSHDPDGLLTELSLFDDYTVARESLEFDIYEDTTNGVIVTTPAGVKLRVDEGILELDTDANDWDDYSSFSVFFDVGEIDSDDVSEHSGAASFMDHQADEHLVYLNSSGRKNFVEYENARSLKFLGEDRLILRSAFNDFDDERQDVSHEINVVTLAAEGELLLKGEASMNRFDQEFTDSYRRNAGTNCSGALDEEQTYLCSEIKKMMQILTSVHLITFANVSTIAPE